jgi:hypothetical protein
MVSPLKEVNGFTIRVWETEALVKKEWLDDILLVVSRTTTRYSTSQ